MVFWKREFQFATLLVAAAWTALTTAASQSWEFAVTSKTKILFYDEHWNELFSAAHQFDGLSAITFDESEELIYFNDQNHNNGSIFSLKIPISDNHPHVIEKMVQRAPNETVRGLSYDPLNRNLFWSDSVNQKIYFKSVDGDEQAMPKVLIDLVNENEIPDGVTVDICRRKLYWTNSKYQSATIESIDLDGNGRKVLIHEDLHQPHGIVLDQLSDRIYWVDDQPGVHFSIESAALDGTDRRTILQATNNVPLNLIVTKDNIYWSDLTHKAIWSIAKSASNESGLVMEAQKVVSFEETTRGIVGRSAFYQALQNDQHCVDVVTKVKQRLLTPKVTRSPIDQRIEELHRDYCLNGGHFMSDTGICICAMGYKGSRCESTQCHNYCVHGTCAISQMGFPKCYCQEGYYGERCGISKCANYCFNDGICNVDSVSGEPNCQCRDNFGGSRCEHNNTEICGLFCRILKHEPDADVPFGCHDICEELASRTDGGADIYSIPRYNHLEVCASPWTSYVIIILVAGVVACFALVALIVHGVRRIYKPARPRIKKTFVVRKQTRTNSSSDTPLTNRPLATEQCEITIENCCNMNICETPCFDPKLVEQTMSTCDSKVRVKEDKKILIHSMEDDLY